MLLLDCPKSFMRYLSEDLTLLHDLALQLHLFEAYLEQADDPRQGMLLFISYLHGLILAIDEVFGPNHPIEIDRLLSGKKQYQLLLLTKRLHDELEEGELLQTKVRVIWHKILSFEMIFKAERNIKLDMKFLITLEQQGLKVLKHYRYLCNNNPN